MIVPFETLIKEESLVVERLEDELFIFRPNRQMKKIFIWDLAGSHIKHFSDFEIIARNNNENIANKIKNILQEKGL